MPGPTPATTQDVATVKKHILTQAQYNAKAAAGEIYSFEEYYITDANPSTVYVSGTNDGTNWTSLTIGNETHGFAGGGGSVHLLVETTYSDLVDLKDGGDLVPGTLYRITDYVTTTSASDTRSANHIFDLIVLATSNKTLDSRAMAIQHIGDTYFDHADLSKWQIWYDIENNRSKYDWADGDHGTGVIYRMIDEWDNDCPYDFKNIQFMFDDSSTISGIVAGVYYYTFSMPSSDVFDGSMLGRYRDNVIKKSTRISLNFIVFVGAEYCCGNTFGCDCHHITIGYGSDIDCSYNTFGNNCSYIEFGEYCHSNIIGDSCRYITFGQPNLSRNYNCRYRYNIVENGCSYICVYDSTSSSGYIQNIKITQGVVGTSSEYVKVGDNGRNNNYQIKVAKTPNGEIKYYCEADLIR